MSGDINVGEFFFYFDGFYCAVWGVCFSDADCGFLEFSVFNIDCWVSCGLVVSEGFDVVFLFLWVSDVVAYGSDERGKIVYLCDLVIGAENFGEECAQVQPFVGAFLQASVVEVEPVNIDDGFHGGFE